MALKTNRKNRPLPTRQTAWSLSQTEPTLTCQNNTVTVIYLEQVSFLYLLRQTCTNADGSTAVRYLVTSDSALTADQLITIYQKRWKEYHRSLKQNASLAKSPTRTPTTQTNHFVAALCLCQAGDA